MVALASTLIETPLGPIGLCWSGSGLAGVQLPEPGGPAATAARLRRRHPAARERESEGIGHAAAEALRAYAVGDPSGLDELPLDLPEGRAFDLDLWRITRAIPFGRTRTYGALATELGDPALARAAGAALGRNPVPIVVPCHRVLAAGGRTGGFSAPGGIATKLRLLALESAVPTGRRDLFASAAG